MRKSKVSLIIISLFFIYAFSAAFLAFSQEQEIGLTVRDDGEDVLIAVKPVAGSSSPLRIHKDGQTYGIELVGIGHPLATNVHIQTPNNGKKALKKYAPLRGRFVCKKDPPKYGWTWITTITCRTSDGGLKTKSYNYADHLSREVWDIVYEDHNNNSRSGSIRLPPKSKFEALRRSTGGSGGGFKWNDDGDLDLDTLNVTCKILGYESYVSSTCYDAERSGRYSSGKCQWHSPHDNYTCYFIPK